MRRERRLVLTVLAATFGIAAGGFVAGGRLESPEDVARRTRPPEPSLITAPVERRPLSVDVLTRGDVVFSESADIGVDADIGQADGEAAGSLVVTGRLPREGDDLGEGAVLVEISGRPVFLLSGQLPMYRSIRPDSAGPDVAQLEAALQRLGHDPGDVDQQYTTETEAAVEALYEAHGYEAVVPTSDETAQLDDAILQLDQARVAERQATDAAAQPDAPAATAEALSAARAAVGRAEEALAEAEATIGTRVPRGEMVFVASLPRKVQRTHTAVGQEPAGAVVTLAGGEVRVAVEVPATQQPQVRAGATATLDDAGVTAQATVAGVAAAPGTEGASTGMYRVWLNPTDEAGRRLVGRNVRVTIPIESTAGPVLAVPAAAVFTRADRQSYVQLVGPGGIEDVAVEVGLSAQGMVEVDSGGDALAEGDEVVVGER